MRVNSIAVDCRFDVVIAAAAAAEAAAAAGSAAAAAGADVGCHGRSFAQQPFVGRGTVPPLEINFWALQQASQRSLGYF